MWLTRLYFQDPAQQKEELAKLGIYFDDDYNYLQHLRDVKQTAEWELAEDSKNSRVWKAPVARGLSVIIWYFVFELSLLIGLHFFLFCLGPSLQIDPTLFSFPIKSGRESWAVEQSCSPFRFLFSL